MLPPSFSSLGTPSHRPPVFFELPISLKFPGSSWFCHPHSGLWMCPWGNPLSSPSSHSLILQSMGPNGCTRIYSDGPHKALSTALACAASSPQHLADVLLITGPELTPWSQTACVKIPAMLLMNSSHWAVTSNYLSSSFWVWKMGHPAPAFTGFCADEWVKESRAHSTGSAPSEQLGLF